MIYALHRTAPLYPSLKLIDPSLDILLSDITDGLQPEESTTGYRVSTVLNGGRVRIRLFMTNSRTPYNKSTRITASTITS